VDRAGARLVDQHHPRERQEFRAAGADVEDVAVLVADVDAAMSAAALPEGTDRRQARPSGMVTVRVSRCPGAIALNPLTPPPFTLKLVMGLVRLLWRVKA